MVGKLYLIMMAQCPMSENSCPAEKKKNSLRVWKGGVSCRQLATQQWRKRYNPDTEGADGETAGNFLETVLTVCCQEHLNNQSC